MALNMYKLKYESIDHGKQWVCTILGLDQLDAESTLHSRVKFEFNVTSIEYIGHLDAISDKVLTDFNTHFTKNEKPKCKTSDKPKRKKTQKNVEDNKEIKES